LVTGTASPTLFLSYAWADKSLARRVARRLRHRGLDVWLDESEMQAGDALPGRIRTAIQSRSHLLVLLTEASVHSSWVSREIAFARELSPEVTVVPITGETNVSSPLLDETLGVDVSDTALLEARLDELVHSIGGNPAERDVVLMRPDLEQLGHELPLLSAIQLSEPQSHAFFDALPIDASTSHEVETFVAIEWDIASAPGNSEGAASEGGFTPSVHVALAAAGVYRSHGLGYYVLTSFAKSCHDRFVVHNMFSRLVDAPQQSEAAIERVCRLLALTQTPQQIALRCFVLREFARLSERQKQWAVAYLVQRSPTPANDAGVTAFAFFKLMPRDQAVKRLWEKWISDGRFDFDADALHLDMAALFFSMMNDAARDHLDQFNHGLRLFQNRVRGLGRGRNILEVIAAADILFEAQKHKYVQLKELCEELAAAPSTAEWNRLALPEEVTRAFFELVADIQCGTNGLTSWVKFREVVRTFRKTPAP